MAAVDASRQPAVSGTEEYRRAGCDLPIVYPVPFGADGQASVAHTLQAFAPST